MELTVFNKTIPLKAYPDLDAIFNSNQFYKPINERNPKTLQIVFFIAKLFSIKTEKEEGIYDALPAIQKHFKNYGLNEIKKAFEMYVDGELNIKPKSNYFDRVLVGNIFYEYAHLPKEKPKKTNEKVAEEYKSEQDYLHVVSVFDHFISTDVLGEESVWIYSYLTETKKVVEFDAEIRKALFQKYYEKLPKQEAIIKSKIDILKQYFTSLNSKHIHIKNLIK